MRRRLPPLNALRAFEAAARLGSFVAAGRELSVTPAAISQQVRALERSLGATLFQRLPQKLVPTDAARAHLAELSLAFDRLAETSARLRGEEMSGSLTVSALPSFASHWLVPRIASFRERHPRIQLILDTSRRLVDFRREGIDLAVRFGGHQGRDLKSVLLFGEEAFPVASPALVGSGTLPVKLEDMLQWPLLHDIDAYPHQLWMSWRGWLERDGIEPSPAERGLAFNDANVLIGAAVLGLGVAIGRSALVRWHLARGQLIRLGDRNWPAEWSYTLTAPPAHFARPRVRAFIDWALAEAAASP